jgi:hypothetical protein
MIKIARILTTNIFIDFKFLIAQTSKINITRTHSQLPEVIKYSWYLNIM